MASTPWARALSGASDDVAKREAFVQHQKASGNVERLQNFANNLNGFSTAQHEDVDDLAGAIPTISRKLQDSNGKRRAMAIKTPQQQLKDLSTKLGLEYEEQDWGIVNSDGTRLEEFVRFYTDPTISKIMQYQVFELVLASTNDALDRGIQPEASLTTLFTFLRNHKSDFPDQVKYWAELTDDKEFPLAKYLRELN